MVNNQAEVTHPRYGMAGNLDPRAITYLPYLSQTPPTPFSGIPNAPSVPRQGRLDM